MPNVTELRGPIERLVLDWTKDEACGGATYADFVAALREQDAIQRELIAALDRTSRTTHNHHAEVMGRQVPYDLCNATICQAARAALERAKGAR